MPHILGIPHPQMPWDQQPPESAPEPAPEPPKAAPPQGDMSQQAVEKWIADQGGEQAVQFKKDVKVIKNPAAQRIDPTTSLPNPNFDAGAPATLTIETLSWTNTKTGAALAVSPKSDGSYGTMAQDGPKPADAEADTYKENAENRAAQDQVWQEEDRQIAADTRERATAQADRTNDRNDRVDARTDVKDQNDAARTAWNDHVAAKEKERQQEIARLNALIEQGKIDAKAAEDQYTRWHDQNVKLPFSAAQEARARAQDERAVQNEERRRAEAAALDAKEATKFGYDAGQDAVNLAKELLPMKVGPGFNDHMAEAINGLSQGKSVSNFTGADFRVKMPNWDQLRKDGAAAALAQWSPYARRLAEGGAAQGIDPNAQLATPTYEGIPAIPDFSTAPAQAPTFQVPMPPTYTPPPPPTPLPMPSLAPPVGVPLPSLPGLPVAY